MILIFPHVLLKEGKCTYCIEGEAGTDKLYQAYAENPMQLCQLWRRENSKTVHMTDIDSFSAENDNIVNINSILFIVEALDIPVQLYSNYLQTKDCEIALESGIYRVVLGDIAVKKSQDIPQLIEKYTASRVAFFCELKDGQITYDDKKYFSLEEYIDLVVSIGGNRIVIKDHSLNDNTYRAKLELYKSLALSKNIRFTIHEGVSNSAQLHMLNSKYYGVDSVILGKALYENNFPCQKMWRKAEAKLEPDFLNRKNNK